MSLIKQRIQESIEVKKKILENRKLIGLIEKAADAIVQSYKSNGRVFFAGNGGSAADAQHLSAELVSRFYMERKGLAAEALHCNTSVLTAIGNDYSFDRIFARQIEANARKGDVLVGLSTSGNSKNIIEALKICRNSGISSIGFTGESGGAMADWCDVLISVPSKDTPRIQESHIMIGHIICEIVEKGLFGKS
jgi:D-sedoheptulose 7-phosphate isomerase